MRGAADPGRIGATNCQAVAAEATAAAAARFTNKDGREASSAGIRDLWFDRVGLLRAGASAHSGAGEGPCRHHQTSSWPPDLVAGAGCLREIAIREFSFGLHLFEQADLDFHRALIRLHATVQR